MSWGAVAIGGGSLLGGIIGSEGQKSAAEKQAGASGQAIEEQREARLAFEQRAEPFRQIGLAAAPALAELLGIQMPSQEQLQLQNRLSQIDAALEAGPQEQRIEGTGGIGGFLRSATGQFGPEGFARTITQPLDVGRGGPTRFPAQTEQLPFDEAGLRAEREQILSQLERPTQAPAARPTGQPAMLEEVNPLVSFLREEGFRDIQETAAAQGRLGAGGTLKDLTRFNTQLAATVVPQLQQQRFNQLFNLLGLGQSSAVGQGTAALQTAGNIGNLQQAIGAAQAQGALGQAQAAQGAIGNLAGVFGAQRQGLFNRQTPTVQAGTFNTGTQVDPATGAVSSPIPGTGFGGF